MDYKNTLNLPHTDFPMKADLVAREPERLNQWEKAGLYGENPGPPAGQRKSLFCTTARRLPTATCTSAPR